MKIGVIGGGVVGSATARAFLEHVDEVRVYDVVKERRTHEFDAVASCDFVFVCLPETSLRAFFDTIDDVEGWCDRNIALKSTVPVGTTRLLRTRFPNLVHSPEFLTARCAFTDAQMPSRNIIGGTGPCAEALADLYDRRWPGLRTIMYESPDTSEMVKLILNGFFAVKVAYFNEVARLVEARGQNFEHVMMGVLTDGRIAPSHTKVPGPDGKRGFGGACLPKDLLQLIDAIETTAGGSLSAPVCRAAHERNKIDRGGC